MKQKSTSSLPEDQQLPGDIQKLEEDDASPLSKTRSSSSSDDKEFDEEMDPKLEMSDHLMASTDKKLKSSSTLPEDQLPPEKKQKLEEDDALPLSNTRSSSSFDGKESDEVMDEEREMTDEEFQEYYRHVVESDGFNVPPFPDVDCCGMIRPLFGYSEKYAQELFGYSERAIAVFNTEKGTAYKVLRVDRVMAQAVRGLKYYITFQAKDGDTTKTFEATVLYGIPEYPGQDATKVILCRLQGDRTVSAVNCFGDEYDEKMKKVQA